MLTLTPVSELLQTSARQKIDVLDFEPVIYKLMYDDKGPKWNLEDCDKYVNLYKKFLLLHLIYPETKLPPTIEIDWVWHFHILDTSKYMVDSDNVFGYYFHHFPYFGLRGSEDVQELAEGFEITRTLFQEQFQIDLLAGLAASQCRDDCVSVPCKGPGDIKGMSELDKARELALQERPRPERK
jgi:hypothetical protein